MTHGEVVEQAVAARLGRRGRHLRLGENPLQTLDGELAHVLGRIGASHDDIHARKTAHGANVDNVVLDAAIAEPRGHKVLHAVHGGRRHGRLLVGFSNAKVECCETLVLTRHIDTGLQAGVVDGKTLYDFHCSELRN